MAMSRVMTASVARQLGRSYSGGSAAGLSDRQLLEGFSAGGDPLAVESAFAALVARHGPMVLVVCRGLLGDHQHAEDAFQATFLVLARRARSIGDPDLLGNWLHGVALRTAQGPRAARPPAASGRGRAVPRHQASAADPADRPVLERERAEALYDEIDRLPSAARTPIVLCYFEGLSLAEAAHRLRCPAGTVHSRLDRAKERLRRGLIRRGIAPSGAALAAALTSRPTEASVTPLLCNSTTRAAIAFAAPHSAAGGCSPHPPRR